MKIIQKKKFIIARNHDQATCAFVRIHPVFFMLICVNKLKDSQDSISFIIVPISMMDMQAKGAHDQIFVLISLFL